jgi:hypothetical protein
LRCEELHELYCLPNIFPLALRWLDSPSWAMTASWFRFRDHLDIPHSVRLLWTSDQLVAETSTSQHTTLTTDRHPCPRQYSNPHSQQAIGRRPTPETARPPGSATPSNVMVVVSSIMKWSGHATHMVQVRYMG